MSRLALLIGEAPPPRLSADECVPLYPSPKGCAGHRLFKLTGMTQTLKYCWAFRRLNLMRECPRTWNNREAAGAMDELMALMPIDGIRYVILVGSRVRDAFFMRRLDRGLMPLRPFEWADCRVQVPPDPGDEMKFVGVSVSCIPHPSGRNHAYNEPEVVSEARKFFADLLEGWETTDEEARLALRELREGNHDPRKISLSS